jgi:hypothetical protein
MKKFFVSTGIAAIGIAGLQSASGQGLDLVSTKAWSISGTLRGFYDDNYNLANSRDNGNRGSWGAEISPTVAVNMPLRQTDMGIRYIYGLYYYDDRRSLHLDAFDQSHQVDAWINHAFNERWTLDFKDSFISSRTPELTTSGPAPATYRTTGDNIANHASLSISTQWTPLFGTSVHYGNDFYMYSQQGDGLSSTNSTAAAPLALIDPGQVGQTMVTKTSLKGLLDRIEQNAGLDLTWTLSPETSFLFGYSYSWVNYTGDEAIASYQYYPITDLSQQHTLVYRSSSRNGDSHDLHVGMTRSLTPNLQLALQAGVNYSDNSNDPFNHSQNVSPTANASLSYTYKPGDYLQFGVTQSHNATDVVNPGTDGSLTQYEETTAVYADLNHKLTEKLFLTLIGRGSYSTFNGGGAAGNNDVAVNASVNLTYVFNSHFSADLGYNFDDLFTSVDNRDFARNRVYFGMTASY